MRAAAILGLGSSPNDLEPFQRTAKADWSLGVPTSPGDADTILLFGGDGTIHRHLAELVRLDRPVLIVPQGSGNDFARALGLHGVKDSLAAWQKFSEGRGNVRTIDLGVIQPIEPPQGLKPDGEYQAIGTTEVVPFPRTRYPVLGTQNYFCCIAGVVSTAKSPDAPTSFRAGSADTAAMLLPCRPPCCASLCPAYVCL